MYVEDYLIHKEDKERNIMKSIVSVADPDELSLATAPKFTTDERRKCKIKHCITILESHNESDYCHIHQRLISLQLRDEFIKKCDNTKSKR